jgi:hypothetical protein
MYKGRRLGKCIFVLYNNLSLQFDVRYDEWIFALLWKYSLKFLFNAAITKEPQISVYVF